MKDEMRAREAFNFKAVAQVYETHEYGIFKYLIGNRGVKHYMLAKRVSTDEEIQLCTLTNSPVFADDFCSRFWLREEQEEE